MRLSHPIGRSTILPLHRPFWQLAVQLRVMYYIRGGSTKTLEMHSLVMLVIISIWTVTAIYDLFGHTSGAPTRTCSPAALRMSALR